MNTKDVCRLVVMASLWGVLVVSGCAKENPPCNTDPSQIEAARAELASAKDLAVSSQAELAQAVEDQAALKKKDAALPDQADLESRLYKLKKGSGR